MPSKTGVRKTTKKTKKKSGVVGVVQKQLQGPWYKNWKILVVIALFGATGTWLLWHSHAATPPYCVSAAQSGNTLKYCSVALPQYNSLRVTADYVAADMQSLMKTATVALQICSPQTLKCTVTDSNSNIGVYTTDQPRYQRLYTQGKLFMKGTLYRVCFSMTTAQGWNINNSCTPLLSYGTDINNAPQVYTGRPQSSASSATTNTTSNANCNSGTITKPDGSAYQCTFDEEFNGTTLDLTKWTGFTSEMGAATRGRDCYVYRHDNVSVSGGTLNLTTRQESAPFTCYPAGQAARTTQFTSGFVSSGRKFSQQYGRFEIRAKAPDSTAPGNMQSFWLWPDKPYDQDPAGAPWPATGEIDIAEIFHAYADRAIPNIHYVPASTDPNVNVSNCYIDITQYHTYTLTWTPDTIKIDIDGYTCTIDHPNPKSPQVNPQPFNKTFYINLTSGLGVMGTNNDYIEGTTPLPATTQVDYVRVWK